MKCADKQGWAVISFDSGSHVIPLDEADKHVEYNCQCGTHDDEGVTVHSAFDKRELFERGERKPS
jgi:hypothetical protein